MKTTNSAIAQLFTAALNILKKGLSTLGHRESKACGETTATVVGESLLEQVVSVKREDHIF